MKTQSYADTPKKLPSMIRVLYQDSVSERMEDVDVISMEQWQGKVIEAAAGFVAVIEIVVMGAAVGAVKLVERLRKSRGSIAELRKEFGV